MADSVCCTAETDNTVSNYTPIKLKKKKRGKNPIITIHREKMGWEKILSIEQKACLK